MTSGTFDHDGLTVADLDAMTSWYVAALTRGLGHLALDVPVVDEAYDKLLAAGATDRMSPRPSPEPGVRMAYVADLDGNLIELLDRTSAREAGRS